MTNVSKSSAKRFSDAYRRSKASLTDQIFLKAMNLDHNGKKITHAMVKNWLYGSNKNSTLDDVFYKMMIEVDPEGLHEEVLRQKAELIDV